MVPELNYKGKGCINVGLRISVSIYFLLYLIFAIDEFLPLNAPESWNLEQSVLKLLYLIFLMGFILSWKFELTSGIIFVFWFLLMCYQSLFICTGDCDDGIIIGIPLFILSIFFIIFGLKKRKSKNKDIVEKVSQ